MIAANHGMIVTVASVAGYLSAPSMVDYASSKAAALSFHEGLAAELTARYNAPKIRTVLMAQSYTRTALFEGFDSKGVLYPETVAESIVKAVWMQYGLRKRLGKLMAGWKGRQVVQPSLAGEEKKVEDSTVLVDKE